MKGKMEERRCVSWSLDPEKFCCGRDGRVDVRECVPFICGVVFNICSLSLISHLHTNTTKP